jgi:hypothetical protein
MFLNRISFDLKFNFFFIRKNPTRLTTLNSSIKIILQTIYSNFLLFISYKNLIDLCSSGLLATDGIATKIVGVAYYCEDISVTLRYIDTLIQ